MNFENSALLRVLTAVAFLATVSVANAASITPATTTPISNGDSVFVETGIGNDTDGNLATGYKVVTSRLTPSSQLWGFAIRWDFDISGYSSINSFDFSLTGAADQSGTIDLVRVGAGRFSNFVSQSAPDGVQFTRSITANGSGVGATLLSNYISGGTLSIFLQTELGTTISPAITSLYLEVFELTANIDGTLSAVPLSATFPLLLSALGFVGFVTRRKPRAS